MTAIDFPNSPTLNQIFSASGRTWKWNGTTWGTVASTTIAPTAHASSHAAAGADAVTVAQSQVTNLATDLAAKASTTDLAAKASLTGAETLTNKTLTSPLLNGAAAEVWAFYGAYPGAATAYLSTNNSIQWYGANSTASGALNLTWSSTTALNTYLIAGQSITATVILTNGATPFYPSSITVDGSAPSTLRWSGGTAPTGGNANSWDVYTFTIVKTGSAAFSVFASVSKFA